jgi:hypothetical protein
MRFGERVSTFCGALLNKTRAKLLPLNIAQFLGFWSSKPYKLEEEPQERRRGWRLGAFIATGITEAGTVRKTTSVNHILTEEVALQQPPRLVD